MLVDDVITGATPVDEPDTLKSAFKALQAAIGVAPYAAPFSSTIPSCGIV